MRLQDYHFMQPGETRDCRQKKYCNRFTNAFETHLPPHPQFQCWECSLWVTRGAGEKMNEQIAPQDVFPNIEIGGAGVHMMQRQL